MNILVADHQARVRFAMRMLLERLLGLKVLGEASSVSELMLLISTTCPDVLLLDWELPDLEASRLMPELRMLCPELSVIAVSSRPEARQSALDAGVVSFINKAAPPDALLAAVNACRRLIPENHSEL